MTLAAALLALFIGQGQGSPPPAQQPTQPPAQPPASKATAMDKADGKAAPEKKGPRPRATPAASLPTVEGEVAEVDHRAHTLRLRVAEGELLLAFDRNTLVLAPGGAVTPLEIGAGAKVRVGRDGDARAAWVELKPTSSTPKGAP